MGVWKWSAALVGVAALALALGIGAFVVDSGGAGVNLLTEAAGVAVGTAVTVLFVDELRRRREQSDSEGLQRNRLISEPSHNLTCLVTRQGSGATAKHMMMSSLRDEKPITVGDIERSIELDHREATLLTLALFPIAKPCQKSEAIYAALADGAYQVVQGGVVEDTDIHAALERVRSDLDREVVMVGGDSKESWSELLELVAPINRPGDVPCRVPGHLLLLAYAYYDVCENLLQEQTSLLRHLLDESSAYQVPPRRPSTPLGPDMEQSLRAEAVLPSEVVTLVRNDIHPFGNRRPAWALGESREEQVARFAELATESMRSDWGVEIGKDAVVGVVEEQFDQWFALDDEGIERIDRPDRE